MTRSGEELREGLLAPQRKHDRCRRDLRDCHELRRVGERAVAARSDEDVLGAMFGVAGMAGSAAVFELDDGAWLCRASTEADRWRA